MNKKCTIRPFWELNELLSEKYLWQNHGPCNYPKILSVYVYVCAYAYIYIYISLIAYYTFLIEPNNLIMWNINNTFMLIYNIENLYIFLI